MSSGIDDRPTISSLSTSEGPQTTIPVPAPKRPSRPSRSRSKARSEPKVASGPTKDPNVPWVILRASQDPKLHRVLIECSRCDCRMSFPDRVPVHKVESLLYGFRIDHEGCKDGDKPEKKGSITETPKLPSKH